METGSPMPPAIQTRAGARARYGTIAVAREGASWRLRSGLSRPGGGLWNLDEDVKTRLRARASRRGQSMEAEARDILRDAVKSDDAPPVEGGNADRATFRRRRSARAYFGLGEAEAIAASDLMAARRARSRPTGTNDALIAGIVRARRATIAPRNLRHFVDDGIDLVDPWAS